MSIVLAGREIGKGDGNPIIGADVYAYNASTGALVDQTTTDANGAWSMTVASLDVGYDVKVVYGWNVNWQYIAQKIQAQSITIDGSITVRDWANANDLTKIDGGDLYVGSLIELASSGSIRSGQTAYNTGTGWWLGDVGGTPKASMGVAGGAGWTWDGTTFAVSGTITATAGTIGGFTILSDKIYHTSGLYLDTALTGQPGILVGSATALLTGDGVFMRAGSPPTFRVGTISAGVLNKGFVFDGTDIYWTGVNTSLTAAGVFTASNAVITGTITATAGTIGGWTLGSTTITGVSSAVQLDKDVGVKLLSGSVLNNRLSWWNAFTDTYPTGRVWADSSNAYFVVEKVNPSTGVTQSWIELRSSGALYLADTVTIQSTLAMSSGNITLAASATVDGVDVSAHDHSGVGQGGTVAVASVTGAAPLASPTFTGQVGIGGSPATSGLLDLQSTTGALIVPRMTEAQRDALTAVAGMIVYNTTSGAFNRYTASWNAF